MSDPRQVIPEPKAKRAIDFKDYVSIDETKHDIHGNVTIKDRPTKKFKPAVDVSGAVTIEERPKKKRRGEPEPEPFLFHKKPDKREPEPEPELEFPDIEDAYTAAGLKCKLCVNEIESIKQSNTLYAENILKLSQGFDDDQRLTTKVTLKSVYLRMYVRNIRNTTTYNSGAVTYRVAVIRPLDGSTLAQTTVGAEDFFEGYDTSTTQSFDNTGLGLDVASLPINPAKYKVYWDTKGFVANNINDTYYDGYGGTPSHGIVAADIPIDETLTVRYPAAEEKSDNIYVVFFWGAAWSTTAVPGDLGKLSTLCKIHYVDTV